MTTSPDPQDRCRLYLITPPRLDDVDAFARTLAEALDGGDVACLQLRLKDVDDDAIRRAAEVLVPLAQARDVAVLMNDRPDLALATGCDGVHVGQDDAPYAEARRLLGENRIVGVTCHDSRDLAMAAGEAGADYVAFGAFYPTSTKDAPIRADVDLLRWWAEAMVVPVVAIGGITPDNARPLIETGADFLAVSAGVWAWPDGPGAAVARLNALMDTHSPEREPA
ncbi:thiamine phosphate synthase [Roseospira visakhapatnamensis]|uniref:Thiamine-phosphate synthase n=1 Tax=Roseospira visakhapatnamensis TaxID=390880 RepID=A0A7W6RG54_9PROT|nr:thiamine phosphate synthase [Roseospira visakhapatnamensis]MBB4267376.1 thiamine-phosphate pyrophosphorylase [Roseospira visakhapatnamensis]